MALEWRVPLFSRTRSWLHHLRGRLPPTAWWATTEPCFTGLSGKSVGKRELRRLHLTAFEELTLT